MRHWIGLRRGWPVTLLLAMATVPWLRAQQGVSSMPAAPSAQQAPLPEPPLNMREYTKPPSYFGNPFAAYRPRTIAAPELNNTPRIDQFLRDGKLYISINDAVALALENNLDLAIARLNAPIAGTDLWRAQAGGSVAGVNSGVVQNTPGGGVGGLGSLVGSGQGGTSVGSGGAGAGAGGVVDSTLGSGTSIPNFEPSLSGSLQLDRLRTPCNTPYCATEQNTGTADFTYSQGFHWGTDLTLIFDNSRVSSNSVYNYLNPALNANLQIRLTQHLLQGFGIASNTRFIQIAKNNLKISDEAFRNQIVTTVDQIEDMYWELVFANEDVRVHKTQMEYAEKTLANNKQQMEIGSLAAIEVVKAQTAVAAGQQTLTVSLTNLDLAQLLMKNAISRTLVDPVLADAEVIPTSTIEVPTEEAPMSTQQLVDLAFAHRPDLAEARINLNNTQISKKAINNALLPTLDLSVYYEATGLGGRQDSGYVCFADPGVCGPGRQPAPVSSISYGSTLDQLFNATSPQKGAILSFNIPIGNRAAQATQVRATLENQQAQLHMQQLENQIRIEVRNAVFSVQQNRGSVDSAQAAVNLARQSLDAEQQKFDIRASTEVLVLQNKAALVQAEATLISAKVSYEKARVELDRSTGLLLEHANILIDDAQRGHVTESPRIPNVPAGAAGRQPAMEPVSRR